MAEAAETPPLLWHYTSFKGLHGIVVEGELIASSLAYLNDTEEFQYTIRAALPLVDSLWASLGDLMTGLYLDNLPGMIKAIFGHIQGQGTYVTCFSQERDDLSQWRSYTPQPPGFAIGFHRDELQSLANSFEFAMQECRYPGRDQLLAEIQTRLNEATAGMAEEKRKLPMPAPSERREEFADKWAFEIVKAIAALAQRNKHPKFSGEREVRLVGSPSLSKRRETVEYRLSGSLVVPYLKVLARPKEGPSPIKAILVGPCPHQEAVIAATRQMCQQHFVRAVVTASEVPFRNW